MCNCFPSTCVQESSVASDVPSPSSLPPSSASPDTAPSSGDALGLGLADDVLLSLLGSWSSYLPPFSPPSTSSGDAAPSSGDALGLGLADGVVLLWQGVVYDEEVLGEIVE
jgi:hypothetical protein